MSHRERDYLYYDFTASICSTCLRRVDAKILFRDGKVLMEKRCAEHGRERVLIADDVDYYRLAREKFIKPSEMPRRFHTPVEKGCPFDCGLCEDHEQHSCLTLVELTDHCNLECPVCYASSGPSRPGYRSLEQVEAMLDAVVESEGEPDVVQLSGGEPTLHPEFFEIVAAARQRPIRHLMVNTNGLRIASDPDFARRLADVGSGFEVYLQFDSLRRDALLELRGADLREVRRRAVAALDELDVSTTLVATLRKGLNDDEVGELLEFALEHRCVRGLTLQPIQDAGRNEGFDPEHHRLTLTEVRRRVLEQSSVFAPEDIVPVPCHPDCIAMGYALKVKGDVVPLTSLVGPEVLVEGARNTITFEHDPALRARLFEAFSTAHSPESSAESVNQLLCCLPQIALEGVRYNDLFRLIIMQFQDAHSLDVRSVKKSCVHVVHPTDHRMIPLETYNLLYRTNEPDSIGQASL